MKLADVLPKIAGNVEVNEGTDVQKKLLLKSESVLEEKFFRIVPYLNREVISIRANRYLCDCEESFVEISVESKEK
jgi:hypothetical protein|nr:MAG TPA: hypothetical protein [Caudoviricetes sp.]